MPKFKNPTMKIANIFLAGYSFLIKKSGVYYFIDKNDTLFNIYVFPHRIYHTFRRRAIYNFPYSYVIDVFTGRQLKYRQGECAMCGACCKGCENLIDGKNGHRICKIHKRREWCNVFYPISPAEHNFVKNKIHNNSCGYKFIEK